MMKKVLTIGALAVGGYLLYDWYRRKNAIEDIIVNTDTGSSTDVPPSPLIPKLDKPLILKPIGLNINLPSNADGSLSLLQVAELQQEGEYASRGW